MKDIINLGLRQLQVMCYCTALLLLSMVSMSGQDTLSDSLKKKELPSGKIRHFSKNMIIEGTSDSVFSFMDDIRNTGKHMTESSGAMAGGKLKVEWLSEHKTGLGTKYRWTGKAAGMKMDFTVEVTQWTDGKEKTWGTVGKAKMIVIDWFEMHLKTIPLSDGTTKAELSIRYIKHKGLWGFLFGKSYSKWCVKSMLKDTRRHFKKP